MTRDGVLLVACVQAFLMMSSRKDAARFVAMAGEVLDEMESCANIVPIGSGQTVEQRTKAVQAAKRSLEYAFRGYVRHME